MNSKNQDSQREMGDPYPSGLSSCDWEQAKVQGSVGKLQEELYAQGSAIA